MPAGAVSTSAKYPLDFDRFTLGDVISVAEIESAYGRKRSDPRFGFSVLAMRQAAKRAFRDRGMLVSIKSVRGDLHILTPGASERHEANRHDRGIRSAVDAHVVHSSIDPAALPDDEARNRHAHTNARQAKVLQAIKRARLEPIELIADTKRITPGRGGDGSK